MARYNYSNIDSALNRAAEQKEKYCRNLLNKKIMYLSISTNNEIVAAEVVFRKSSYLHLTGLDYKNLQSQKRMGFSVSYTGADEFFERLGKDDSLIKDVSFIQGTSQQKTREYYNFTQHKLDNLAQLATISLKAEFIGKYNGNQNFDVIINKNNIALAFIRDNKLYIPVSSLYGKADDVATNVRPITAILSKSDCERSYQLEYLNPKVSLGKAYFERELTDKLSLSSFENPQVKFNSGKLEEIKRTFQLSEAKYISQDLSEISQLRKAAFENDEALNAYIGKCKVFRNRLDSKTKMDVAFNVLEKQLENETDSEVKKLINDELNELKYQQSMSAAAPYVMKCEFKPLPENISHGGAAVITAEPTSPNGLFGKIKDALKNLLTKKSDSPQEKADNEAPEDIYTKSYSLDFPLPLKQQHRREQESNDTFPQKEVTANSVQTNDKTNISENKTIINESLVPKELTALIEAREAFAAGNLPQAEYEKAVSKYMYSLHGREMWTEAAESLRKQLEECPDNMKKYIGYELKSIELNIEKKFPSQRQQTLDEIKSAAHVQYVKLQTENKAAEKEIHTAKNKSER